MPTSAALTAAIETALNQAFALDPETRERLHELDGKVIALDLRGFGITLYLLPGPEGIHVMQDYAGEPDTRLESDPWTLARLGLGEHGEDRLFAGEVKLSGDMHTGAKFREILGQLDMDWEEALSKLTGDVVAHGIGQKVRDVFAWTQNAGSRLRDDAADYMHYEHHDAPTRYEVDEFIDAVDHIRADVERMAARIQRLQSRIKDGD